MTVTPAAIASARNTQRQGAGRLSASSHDAARQNAHGRRPHARPRDRHRRRPRHRASRRTPPLEPGDTLDEVVVTANRREQNVLDVPYNISAVSGPTLSNAGVANLSDISRLLPGVTIPDLGPRANSSNSLIIIRGLNVNDPVNSAYLPWGSVPTVSTYVDDVPLFVNLQLADIQRIEVLRGPQGTLYGSGAVGGTIKILHNVPDLKAFSAEVSTEVSKTDHADARSYGANGILNIPLSDNIAFRLSAGYENTAGFINALNEVVFGRNEQPVLADPANPLTSGLSYHTVLAASTPPKSACTTSERRFSGSPPRGWTLISPISARMITPTAFRTRPWATPIKPPR